jgi:hypothetical protein
VKPKERQVGRIYYRTNREDDNFTTHYRYCVYLGEDYYVYWHEGTREANWDMWEYWYEVRDE